MIAFITLRTSIENAAVAGITVNTACVSWMETAALCKVVLHMVHGTVIATTVEVAKLG